MRLPLASNARPVTVEGCSSVFSFVAGCVEHMHELADARRRAGRSCRRAKLATCSTHFMPKPAMLADVAVAARCGGTCRRRRR